MVPEVYWISSTSVSYTHLVSELIERGLIQRNADSQDGRGVSLDLTRTGRALYDEIFPAAVERNEDMLSVLSLIHICP